VSTPATSGPGTVPAFFQAALDRLGAARPILSDRAGDVTLGEVLTTAAAVAHGLRRRGLQPGDRVGFWADNSRRWMPTDLAIQVAGGISVPRGTDTPDAEMADLFAHADVGFVFVHDARTAARLERIRGSIPALREVVVLDPAGVHGLTLDRLAQEGAGGPAFGALAAVPTPDDVATIIYTSGTTGRPKGVVLTQSNFAHQVATIPSVLGIGPDDVFLSILPPWHIFERTVEYVALTQGARLVFTDRRRFREDLAECAPTFVPSVPRLWQMVYDGIEKALTEGTRLRRGVFAVAYFLCDLRARAVDRAKGHSRRVRKPRGLAAIPDAALRAVAALGAILAWPGEALLRKIVFSRLRKLTGGRLRGAVVGGGLMPAHLDRFFRAVGVGVLVGYGLTETSPVLTVRRERRNVIGTIGTAIPQVEIEIRDLATGSPLPRGATGVIHTRGPQVMRGYHRDDALTASVVDANGWFDTGDLGWLTEEGDLVFAGRAKETIVLAGGENVEPSRVEESILPSPLIEQAVVVGQDRKTLAVLVWPRLESVRKALGIAPGVPDAEVVAREDVARLVRDDVVARTGPGSGLRPFEVVARVALLPEPMTQENGCLTQTLKVRRHVVAERHASLVEDCYR
jgi:long-chain acyl-CoA synthetase